LSWLAVLLPGVAMPEAPPGTNDPPACHHRRHRVSFLLIFLENSCKFISFKNFFVVSGIVAEHSLAVNATLSEYQFPGLRLIIGMVRAILSTN
jgi:hypothetical protein